MNIVKSIAVAIVVATSSLLFVSATVQAYDFANVCPAQAPPKWAISAQAWTQFVNSCIANDAAATAGRRFDRPLWDKCIEKCGLADDAEGRTPPTPRPQNQTNTSGSPPNPGWCADVPASPPPPNFDKDHPGKWAAVRKMCTNAMKAGSHDNKGCGYICGFARDLWRLQKSGQLNQPSTFPTPSDKPQGPFPLPGGGSGFILPAQPAPAPSGPTSDATDALSGMLSSVVLPPGPFSSFPGQDLSATTSGQGQPPNVSADVSPTQNAEFINFLGLGSGTSRPSQSYRLPRPSKKFRSMISGAIAMVSTVSPLMVVSTAKRRSALSVTPRLGMTPRSGAGSQRPMRRTLPATLAFYISRCPTPRRYPRREVGINGGPQPATIALTRRWTNHFWAGADPTLTEIR
jgi:hypothetical protein